MAMYREATPDGKLLMIQGHPTLEAAVQQLQANLDLLIDAGFTVDVENRARATARKENLRLVLTAEV